MSVRDFASIAQTDQKLKEVYPSPVGRQAVFAGRRSFCILGDNF
jgi:hypothetical protein